MPKALSASKGQPTPLMSESQSRFLATEGYNLNSANEGNKKLGELGDTVASMLR